MQRRLVKSLEDLVQHYDDTVRNSSDEVVQFEYGGDGLDPMMMEGRDKPVDFGRVLHHVKAVSPCKSEDPVDADTIVQSVDQLLEDMSGENLTLKKAQVHFANWIKNNKSLKKIQVLARSSSRSCETTCRHTPRRWRWCTRTTRWT